MHHVKLSMEGGTSLGYGTTRNKTKPKLVPAELLAKEDDGHVTVLQATEAVP